MPWVAEQLTSGAKSPTASNSVFLGEQSYHVSSMAFSRDGHQLITGLFNMPTILLGRRQRQETGPIFAGHPDRILSVAFSLDGRQVLTGSQGGNGNLVGCVYDR